MISALKNLMLRVLKVPPEPHLPTGSAATARVFRASRRYFQLKLLGWGAGQILTLIGLVSALAAMRFVESGELEVLTKVPFQAIILRFIGWIEIIGIVGFLAQLPVSLTAVILDWELRWYIVTDRSLRIREGVRKVSEMTMTFDNVQDVSIRQGPVERLFGISNLRVRTAGGGGRTGSHEAESEEKSGHIGYFRGVDNAPAIRDLILERLKRLRDSGLGDPDQAEAAVEAADAARPSATLGAARELLEEARTLRHAVAS
ncbi:MAG: PH domain-containing protein [Acidobacteriota bacterium]